MNLWFTSDTHFYHKRICEYSSRPYSSVEEMNEALIANWNELVKPNDTVWHLGDFSFGDYKETCEVIRRLNGSKYLILGNHDKMIRKDPMKFISISAGGPAGFRSIQNYTEINHNKTKIVLAHYGHRVWNGSHRGSIHLYGHSHGSLPPMGRSVDVGVDCKEITDEYRPVSVEEIFKYMDKRDICVNDHHGKSRI